MSEQLEAYCVKCKTKRVITHAEAVYTAAGTPATTGLCEVCGTKLFRMGATDAHANLPKPEGQIRPASKKSAGRKSTKRSKPNAQANSKLGKPKSKIGKLVIVESPAKARSVGGFLGKEYTVMASKGHVRDLLVSQLSVDVNDNFRPTYRVPNDKRDTVKELKQAAAIADEIYLATDPDREGEAIAWHLIAAAEMENRDIKRVVFHEITKPAIQQAFDHPRPINDHLVNAQQARRILDRLVGYNITELLWDKVRNRLSAGRVQSIALRFVVERERAIEAFVPQEYWTLDAIFEKQAFQDQPQGRFTARLIKIKNEDVSFGNEDTLRPHLNILQNSRFIVKDIKKGTRIRKPSPPFTTSTLQQEASRRLGFSAQKTMRAAQQLYEGIDMTSGTIGLITYMRTDSLSVSELAQDEARQFIHERYGTDYLPERAPIYKTKSKAAQEAHEAIRPTSVLREPDAIKSFLTNDQYRLYKLIWERFVASQMSNAIYNTMRVDIAGGPTDTDMPYLFRASGSTIKFLGFLAVYEETQDEDALPDTDEGRIFPDLSLDELLQLIELLPEQHFTQPPPRYTEATLVKALEEFGIGRPSTYAPTVAVIQDRDYVIKQDKRLIPTETGKIVNDLLVSFFPNEMDYQFTARMEDQLDDIAQGDRQWQPMLAEFYTPFQQRLQHAREHMPQVRQQEMVGRDCPVSGHPLVIRYGRWGKFIGCSDYPNCTYTEPYIEYTGIACPSCGEEHGGELVERKTRKGRTFYGCSRYPDCEYSTWKLPKKTSSSNELADEEIVPDMSAG